MRVGIPDARTPSGGLGSTVVDVMRGMRNQPTPTGVVAGEDGVTYFDSEVSEDTVEQVFDLIDLVIAGPPRLAHLRVTLSGFSAYGDDYTVTHQSNGYLGVVPIRGSARSAVFPVLVGDYSASTVFAVGTPSSEGTVSATLWVPNPPTST
jgi:hypothetical protein